MYLPVLLGISIHFRKIKFPEIPQKYFVIVMAIIDAGIAGLIMKCCIAYKDGIHETADSDTGV